MTARTMTVLAMAFLLGALVATPAAAGGTRRALPAPEATPLKQADYKFSNTRQSSVAGAPALTNLGPGANVFATENVDGVNRTVLQFPAANGLQLANATSVIPANRYTIVVKMRFDDVGSYERVIDYDKGTSDDGVYVFAGGLAFYPTDLGPSAGIAPDEWVNVVVTRSQAGRLRGYVDGDLHFDATDTTQGLIGVDTKLRFFRDNPNREESSGAVSRIRLYDQSMTPAQVLALGT